MHVESIRLSLHGWVIRNAQLYSPSPDDLAPLLNATRLSVTCWPVDWSRPLRGGLNIAIQVPAVDVSLGDLWEEQLPKNCPYRTVKQVDVAFTASPGQLTLKKAALSWNGIKLSAQGSLSFAGESTGKLDTSGFESYLIQGITFLENLRFTPSPQINLDFGYSNTQPDNTFLNATLSAKDILWKGHVYNHLSGALEYRNARWALSNLQLSQSIQESFVLRGEFDTVSRQAQLSIDNSLSAADLLDMLPENLQALIAKTGINIYGRLDFAASAGPAPLSQLAEKLEVQIHCAQLTRLDLTLDPVSLRVTRDGDRLDATGIQAIANGNPLTGTFSYNLSSNTWNATVKTQCEPTPIGTLVGGGLQEFISRFRFPNELLRGDLTLSQANSGAHLLVTGTLAADRFTCAGVPVEHFDTFMVLSNGVLHLSPLNIKRGQEQFNGSVQVDFDRELASFDATNSFPPKDIAQALAPGIRTILEDIRLDGPLYAVGRGQLDYGAWTNHAFQGTVQAENIGYGLVQATQLHSEVKGHGSLLLFSHATATLYGGTAEGTAEFDLSTDDGSAPYRFDVRLNKLDLVSLLKQLSGNTEFGKTRGKLSATIELTADAKGNFWRSVKGRGNARIENGYLADIPFFGGFSRLIQSSIPSFSFFSLTAFSADYALHGGSIWSDNIQLEGSIFSSTGHGHYSPETGLNILLISELLGQSKADKNWYELQHWAADAVKLGTSPLFRMLEIQLIGPLNNPQWSFINLPTHFSSLFKNPAPTQ